MTKEQWQKRQEQWKRFHAWEAEHDVLFLSPEERLAEVGALVDLALAQRQPKRESARELMVGVEGIAVMRQRLAYLGKTA